LTTAWQDRSWFNACARNIDNVSVGGKRRSRWAGSRASTASNNSVPVSTLNSWNASARAARRATALR
jgi:hypothetical protein